MKRRATAGYTILEVMIVLAVTTALFLSVVVAFSGRQASTQLTQSVRDLESLIQDVSNDVANGFFPNGYECVLNGSGETTVSTATTATPGSEAGCTFLGKAMSFNSTALTTITILGRQYVGGVGTAPAKDLTEARPKGINGLFDTYNYQYGLAPIRAYDINSGLPYASIAFISQLGAGIGVDNPLTGSRTTQLYGVAGSTINDSPAVAAGKVGTTNLVLMAKGARVCLRGGNGTRAEITIGASGNQASTSVTIGTGAISSVCQNA